MQVLHICHSYYPPFLDCARQYSRLFSHSGYKVITVYLTGPADVQVEQATCSDEVIFLGYKSKDVRGLKLNAIARIKQISATHDFTFCIAHRSKPTYVALLATKLPVISVHHNFGDFKRITRRLLVTFFRKRLFMLGVSNAVRDEIRNQLSWPAKRIETLYNRIDVDKVSSEMLTRNEARQALNLPENAYVIANVGRLHHDKDQSTLLHGFANAQASLPAETILLIMGAGPLESSLKQLAHRLGITERTIFTGHIAEARRYFKAFDLFALTSDHEPFGMVLLEAMVANIPIICSDCGGGAEIVSEFGKLFPLGNADKLSDALIIVSRSGVDFQKMQKVLRENFSDEAGREKFWSLSFVKSL